jgi:hypothetical protein
VAEGAVEDGDVYLVEPTHGIGVQLRLGQGEDVVADDHALLG